MFKKYLLGLGFGVCLAGAVHGTDVQAAPFQNIYVRNYWGFTPIKVTVPGHYYDWVQYRMKKFIAERSQIGEKGIIVSAPEAGTSGQRQAQTISLKELEACWNGLKKSEADTEILVLLENFGSWKGFLGFGTQNGQLYKVSCSVYQPPQHSKNSFLLKIVNEKEVDQHIRLVGGFLAGSEEKANGGFEAVSNFFMDAFVTASREKVHFPISQSIVLKSGASIVLKVPTFHEQGEHRYVYWDDSEIKPNAHGHFNFSGYSNLAREITSPMTVRIKHPTRTQQVAADLMNRGFSDKIANAETDGQTLGTLESRALESRKSVTHEAIRAMSKTDVANTPNIGLAYSGGGLRAMFSALGFTMGMEEAGLLNTIQYNAGLSGSTWFMMKWLKEHPNKSLAEMARELTISMEKGLIAKEIQADSKIEMGKRALEQMTQGTWFTPNTGHLAQLEASKICKDHRCPGFFKYSTLDLWSHTLGQRVFSKDLKNEKYTFTLSSTGKLLTQGRIPLPIFTAIRTGNDEAYAQYLEMYQNSNGRSNGERTLSDRDYDWLDITPFTSTFFLSSSFKGHQETHIPTWALGRKFQSGQSVKEPRENFTKGLAQWIGSESYRAEPSAAQMMGAFGSAFSVSLSEVGQASQVANVGIDIAGALGSALLAKTLGGTQEGWNEGFKRWTKPTNLAKGLTIHDFTETSETVEIRDGGIFFNLPIPSLFDRRRNLDIAVVLDSSGDLHESPGSELSKFRRFSHSRKYFGKTLSSDLLDKATFQAKVEEAKRNGITVFNDPRHKDFDRNAMTLVYVPTYKAEAGISTPTKHFGTFKLQYSREESSRLIDYNLSLARTISEELKDVTVAMTQRLNEETKGSGLLHYLGLN